MSKAGKETENTGKVVTKYDLKMERRRKEREKEERTRKRLRISGIVILVCIVAVLAGSIGTGIVRKQKALNGAYIKIGEHEITKLEYDYYYKSVSNNYVATYSSLLSYMGLDATKDFAQQAYSETMTWKDFFDQMTVSQLQEIKALNDDAKAAGFEHDLTEDYETFKTNLATAVDNAGVSKGQYYEEMYGTYATEKNVQAFVKETLLASAYYEKLAEDNAPSQEEVDTYYAENKNNYDTVDYRSFTFSNAEVTEASEEADRKDAVVKLKKSAEEFVTRLEAGEDFNALCAEYSEEEEAKANYENKEEDYSLSEKVTYSSAHYTYSDWLFDEARAAGEIEIIEDEANARCYVLQFAGRNADMETINETILDTLSNQAAGEYVSALSEGYAVTDVAGDLTYLTIQEESTEEASEEVSEEGTSEEEASEEGTTAENETAEETVTE